MTQHRSGHQLKNLKENIAFEWEDARDSFRSISIEPSRAHRRQELSVSGLAKNGAVQFQEYFKNRSIQASIRAYYRVSY